ncbi:hypothetical protein HYW46_04890 [Candidatus Daviesbacteria bacterium]|nr:hypothetical protein [Candidatus Daviesbacteria bacterium]
MSENNTGPEFLQQKYQLNKDPGVIASAQRREQQTGEKVDQGDFQTRIQNYLDRLRRIINPPKLEGHDGFDRKERNLAMIKEALYRQFITTPEDIPESYYDAIKRRHREEGHGDIEIPKDYRQELAQTIIEDQKKSLDLWVDYLASDEAKYPDFLKYFAFRSVLRMGNYDKNKGIFNERTKGRKTVAPFPELNREALAIVLGDLEKKYPSGKAKSDFEFMGRSDISYEAKQKYQKALENKNFADLYALALEEFKPIAEELLKKTEGSWIKYPKESDPKKLVDSIANYGTGWCLRGEAMAQRYLVRDKNDLYVYYSQDQAGKSVVPRVVMVINQNGKITEIRGVATQEHLDPYIGQVVEDKLKEPEFKREGQAYKKRSSDMKHLTAIENKIKAKEGLTGEDLIFLYEIDSKIEGFGYGAGTDPRVKELLSQRKPEEDMLIIFNCEPSQIAHTASEIKSGTKAFVGQLEPGIFDLLSKYNIEHIYTNFPEGKIQIQDLTIGGKQKEQLLKDLREANIKLPFDDLIESYDFTTLPGSKIITVVRLKVKDLGFTRVFTDLMYQRASDLGLDLCLPEVAVYQRLKDISQPPERSYWIAMKQIADRYNILHIFHLVHRQDGLWLDCNRVLPIGGRWNSDYEFVFTLRKSKSSNL